MPAAYIMSWEPSTRRWRKMASGKSYVVSVRQLKKGGYLPADAAETKEASYRAANRWWVEHGEKNAASLEPRPHRGEIAVLERKRDWCKRHRMDEEADRYAALVRTVKGLEPDVVLAEALEPDPRVTEAIEAAEAFGATFPPNFARNVGWHLFDDPVWGDRFSRDAAEAAPVGRTVGASTDRYLDMVKMRYDAGEISAAEYQHTRLSLHAFRDWAGPAAAIDGLDADAWERWWLHLLKSDYSVATKKKRLLYARVFIRWLASKQLMPLPPNLLDRRYGFKEGPRQVPMPDLGEVRRVVEASAGQMKLHLLLMLNCGFTQIDVAELRQDEVDWERGRVVRRRSKTRSKKSVPVVNYPLWAGTWELLKRFRQPSGDLALRTNSGRAWVRDEIDPEGKRHKTDQLRTDYGRLRSKLGSTLALSTLRKVGPTLLADSDEYAIFAQRFLGHAPTSIAEKHYIGDRAGQERFDRAVGWIESRLGLSC